MDYLEAIESDVTVAAAIRQCRNSNAAAWIETIDGRKAIVGILDGDDSIETIAYVDPDGMVYGGDVLAWLGY
jgi:hypothetical protein